jgi:hypothetical protein
MTHHTTGDKHNDQKVDQSIERRRVDVVGRVINFIVLVVILGIVGMLLEYFGVINLVPTFGREDSPDVDIGILELTPEFTDVSPGVWAEPFILGLAQENVVSGFPNGEFRPRETVSRAEFAAMVQAAFGDEMIVTPDNAQQFADVPSDFWATDAIAQASANGFLAGYPNDEFRPDQRMTRVNALVAIANGLELPNTAPPEDVLQIYADAEQIPDYAREAVAAATEAGIVVNFPNQEQLNPNLTATRADVAAFIYQAMVETDQADVVDSEFIVRPQS